MNKESQYGYNTNPYRTAEEASIADYSNDSRPTGYLHGAEHHSNQQYRDTAPNSTVFTGGAEKGKRKRKLITKKCCIIFWIVVVVLLIILGVAGYFLVPRIPTANFENLEVGTVLSSKGPVDASRDVTSKIKLDTSGSIFVPLVLEVSVDNPNYIPWTFKNVTVDVDLILSDGSKAYIGLGGLPNSFKMPAKSKSNTMFINFPVNISAQDPNLKNIASTMVESCFGAGKRLKISYEATVLVNGISWLGIKPKITDTASFACPLTGILGPRSDLLDMLQSVL
ncbi:hypothetical protein AX774_g1996 [Zancudomyces culisetae]|uniref:Late embryogenesis abundant protein LEA-2 subgroup domain-containing protein n=1 Tax=Zancudomyces culisetae TaxID=1213189 RepID=A0A1R1PU02_ZANCU|nr:hypothetical protein AX774_g1996 [Zancudomyces culisetae]|eukprot:OMH84476.1 hypothetical protein AX774_g1996 [Zancudomyces culisetae]